MRNRISEGEEGTGEFRTDIVSKLACFKDKELKIIPTADRVRAVPQKNKTIEVTV